MAGKLLLEIKRAETQTIESGKALAKFLGLKEEMPTIIRLANGAALVLSSKKDAYYYTSLNSCTCKAGEHHKICRHRRDLCQITREAIKGAKAPKTLLQEMAEQGYEMSFEPDPAYDTRAKPEPRLNRMVQAAKDAAGAKLELFGNKPFKPCLE